MELNLKQKLGQTIQKYRKIRNLTQEQLAEKIGIDQKNISKIENGNNYPTAENLTLIAKALDVEIYELFLYKDISIDFMKQEIINSLDDNNNIFYLYHQLKVPK